jgi:hypothetical protein
MFQYEEYIYEVYREKSFTKAADKLFVSQPALSAAVKKQEERLALSVSLWMTLLIPSVSLKWAWTVSCSPW